MKFGFTNSLSVIMYGSFAYYSLLQKMRSAALTTGMRRAGVGHSRHMKSCQFQTNVEMPGNIAQGLLFKQFHKLDRRITCQDPSGVTYAQI